MTLNAKQTAPSLFASMCYVLLLLACTTFAQRRQDYFKITVIDEETGRGVPMVELIALNAVRYVTDSNGVIAFYEPHLMNYPQPIG